MTQISQTSVRQRRDAVGRQAQVGAAGPGAEEGGQLRRGGEVACGGLEGAEG